eukprot:MONOS_3811.1-p1 / transcript=MONOS_3811.1 / gene=MONOS_3811 / organism=Monocercomonoides_exilis_PA203 / gene_product=unspecified product / transcript_product=unspecified product / location=Mono_scaffold00093:76947-79562(-) / protein_length=776 / sequence_SO=supercontig / SO=protein_coding / is_pseudo=false
MKKNKKLPSNTIYDDDDVEGRDSYKFNLYKQSKMKDLSSFYPFHCIYIAGNDKRGNPVVVIQAHTIPTSTEKTLLFYFFYEKIFNIAFRPFSIFLTQYFQNASYSFSISDLSLFYKKLPSSAKQSVANIFILGSSSSLFSTNPILKLFLPADFKSKLHFFEFANELDQIIAPEELRLANCVYWMTNEKMARKTHWVQMKANHIEQRSSLYNINISYLSGLEMDFSLVSTNEFIPFIIFSIMNGFMRSKAVLYPHLFLCAPCIPHEFQLLELYSKTTDIMFNDPLHTLPPKVPVTLCIYLLCTTLQHVEPKLVPLHSAVAIVEGMAIGRLREKKRIVKEVRKREKEILRKAEELKRLEERAFRQWKEEKKRAKQKEKERKLLNALKNALREAAAMRGVDPQKEAAAAERAKTIREQLQKKLAQRKQHEAETGYVSRYTERMKSRADATAEAAEAEAAAAVVVAEEQRMPPKERMLFDREMKKYIERFEIARSIVHSETASSTFSERSERKERKNEKEKKRFKAKIVKNSSNSNKKRSKFEEQQREDFDVLNEMEAMINVDGDAATDDEITLDASMELLNSINNREKFLRSLAAQPMITSQGFVPPALSMFPSAAEEDRFMQAIATCSELCGRNPSSSSLYSSSSSSSSSSTSSFSKRKRKKRGKRQRLKRKVEKQEIEEVVSGSELGVCLVNYISQLGEAVLSLPVAHLATLQMVMILLGEVWGNEEEMQKRVEEMVFGDGERKQREREREREGEGKREGCRRGGEGSGNGSEVYGS